MTATLGSVRIRAGRTVRQLRDNPMPLWLVPSLVYALIMLIPFASSIYYSLTEYRPVAADQVQWVGLNNWVSMLKSSIFWNALKITVLYWVLGLLVELPLGLGVALLLNRELPAKGVLRTILVIPMMIPIVVTGLTWQIMMNPMDGVLNFFLTKVGLSPISWLADTRTALYSLVIITTWWAIPFVTMVLLPALQGISQELYECAKIDGASSFRCFRHITLPQIIPYLLMVTVFRTIDLFKVFGIIYITTEGGPGRATTTLHMEAYDRSFRNLEMGAGLPYALVLTIILIVVVFVLEHLWNRSVRYSSGAA